MMELIQAIPFGFAALFPVINPIGSSVIVLSLANGSSAEELNRLAFKIALYTAVMLTIVLFAGSWILRIFGITIPIVLLGGGLVIAYIGWQLLNQSSSGQNATNVTRSDKSIDQMAFFPLTMPVTAGPGCIAVAITLGAHSAQTSMEASLLSQLGYTIALVLVSVSVYLCYRFSHNITSRLGASGTQVLMRLAAFINLCIGMQIMWHGVQLLLA